MKTYKIIASATFTALAPKGYMGQIIATAKAEQYGGNSHPHFSVTGEISTPREHNQGDAQAYGCIHEEILKSFPFLAPLVALHLSNSDDGEPMHATADGFYNLAGTVAHHFGEEYHRGNSEQHFPRIAPVDHPGQNTEYRLPTELECLRMLADHLRISLDACQSIRQTCLTAYAAGCTTVATSPEVTEMVAKAQAKAGCAAARKAFSEFVDTLRAQWKTEADNGVALIVSLAAKK